MKIYDELKLRFDTPLWALYPELALFDTILTKRPDFVQMVSNDVLLGLSESNYGRKDSPSVEQVLRAAIFKEVKQLTYRELENDMLDSKVCNMFLRLDENQSFSYSVLQKYISKISEDSIRKIIIEINKIAVNEKIENIEKISTDTTTIETDVHHPSNNSLVYDCIKVATEYLKKIKKEQKDNDRLESNRQRAKKINYQINNVKKEEHPELFKPYLEILKGLIIETWLTIRNQNIKTKKTIKIIDLLPTFIKVYKNAVSHQLQNKPVENSKKIFSIFELHTDILVKGIRDVEFGHKTLFTRGESSMILDFQVFEGNPSDKDLLIPSVENVINNYQQVPVSTSNDGGFCSKANQLACKALGIANIVFTKVTKSLKNIAFSSEVELALKKWRSSTEAVISNIKRGFGLKRVSWEGFAGFCSKVAWSVLGYNLRVMCNRILE